MWLKNQILYFALIFPNSTKTALSLGAFALGIA